MNPLERTRYSAMAILMMLAVFASTGGLHGEVITNVLGKAFSEYPTRMASYTVNGIGLTGDAHTNVADGYMWQAGDSNGWFRVYLNRECFVEKIRVWNYNESGQWPKRGARLTDMYTAVEPGAGGVGWQLLAQDYELTKAPGTVTYDTPDEIDVNRTALHIRFNIKSAWSTDAKVGLSQVQVIGTPADAGIWISNVTATAISQGSVTLAADAVNGNGLTGYAHKHDAGDNTAWLSSGGDPTSGWFRVDLGDTYTLRRIDFWNYNNGAFGNRGIKYAHIHTAVTDPGGTNPGGDDPWVQVVTNQYFPRGPYGNALDNTPLRLIMNHPARYVGFEILDNWDGNKIGFCELQFHGHPPPQGTVISIH